jgi:hypothetical protein
MKLRGLISALAALCVVIGITLAAGGPASALHGRIIGRVTDATTGVPLDNVCITVGPPIRCWTATNASGNYVVDLTAIGPDGQSWELFYLRTGYTTANRTYVVNGDTNGDIALASTSPGSPPPPAAPPPNLVQPPPPVATGPTFKVFLPNVTRMLGGRYGWHTPFIVQNVGTVSTSLRVEYFRFSDGSLVATRTASVLPGRSFVGSPNDEGDLPENTQFSVVITSVGAPVVAVVNEHQGGPGVTPEALSYSGLSTGSTKVSLPLVSKMAGGWLTTMIMQNLGANPTVVTGTFRRLDMAGTATITRTVLPGRSQFIDPRSEAVLLDGAEYAATFAASEPFAVVANAHNDLPGTVRPMGDSYNGVPNVTMTTTYSPYVAKNTDGIGRSSRVVVQNAGTAAATPTIAIRAYGSSTDAVVSAPSIEPGTSWSFVPVVADGEYSLIVSGGTFAVLATAISPATAMFYTGTSALATKLFMPNVTRTLTAGPGDPGWTTPLLVQSADATSATLRWFRFSDGTLVTSQTITLSAGSTTRVDPRTVPGLTDNTQFAVTLDSPGQVVAIVTELNLLGGDNAMIYKAFLTP